MSFLVDDKDDVATLEEALAFIDSLERDDSSDAASSNGNASSPTTTDTRISAPTKRRQKKRKRSNLSSSTRLHQRKKAEVLYLRRHAQELEEYIEKLKLRSLCHFERGEEITELKWMELAETHLQARLRSEETNHSLKSLMASQMQVSDVLRGILQKQVSYQEMDIAYTRPAIAGCESTVLTNGEFLHL